MQGDAPRLLGGVAERVAPHHAVAPEQRARRVTQHERQSSPRVGLIMWGHVTGCRLDQKTNVRASECSGLWGRVNKACRVEGCCLHEETSAQNAVESLPLPPPLLSALVAVLGLPPIPAIRVNTRRLVPWVLAEVHGAPLQVGPHEVACHVKWWMTRRAPEHYAVHEVASTSTLCDE
jgi:hypothetical protein